MDQDLGSRPNARRRCRVKHGGEFQRVDLDESSIAVPPPPDDDLIALNEVLERFEAKSSEKAQLVKLRYFAGLTLEQAADAMGISRATASRYWLYSRAWLYEALHSS
jgi:RNA polymerase sigma factor (sigma-70 family)